MTHKLAGFFKKKGILEHVTTHQISSAEYAIAISALRSDVDSFFINGLVSLSASIHSLSKANFSWSFIQSYYTIFYLARAFNGVNGYAIIYNNRTPYGIKIQPSGTFYKLKGNSHDVVLNQFKIFFSSDILLKNTIEDISPIDWFNSKRNYINYTLNPLPDPNPPIHLYDHKNELRNWIATYINDIGHKYTFDPRHCFISYPLQLFVRIFEYYTDNEINNIYMNEERIKFFNKNFADSKGPITVLTSRLTELCN